MYTQYVNVYIACDPSYRQYAVCGCVVRDTQGIASVPCGGISHLFFEVLFLSSVLNTFSISM